MVAALTTDRLVDEVRDQACIPDVDGRLGSTEAAVDAAILRLASNVLRTHVADLLIGSRAQRWTQAASDQAIASGTHLYAMPERALAAGVADVLITDGTSEWSAPEITLAQAWRYRVDHGGWDSPYAYCWRDDEIELLPHPTAGGHSLRVLYPRGLLRLVTVASCALVASTGATSITTDADVPSAWSSSETLDVVRGGPNGAPRGTDLAGTSISGTSITVSAGVPSTVAAGDYVCLAGETCIPPVPDVAWPALVAGASLEVLRAIGDPAGVPDARERLAEAGLRAQKLLTPRSRGASRKIVARGYGTRRGMR